MEIHVTSGDWISDLANNQKTISTSREYISAAEILKKSIRRSWTISNPENEQQNQINNYQTGDRRNYRHSQSARVRTTGSHPTLTRFPHKSVARHTYSAQQIYQLAQNNMDYNDINAYHNTPPQRRVLRQSTLPTTISANPDGNQYYYQNQKNLTAPTSPKCQISPQYSMSYSSENVIINNIGPECDIQPPNQQIGIGMVPTNVVLQSQLQPPDSPTQTEPQSGRLTVRRQSTLPCLPTESSPYIYMQTSPNRSPYSRSPERSEGYPPLFRQSTLPSNLSVDSAAPPPPYLHRTKLLPTSPNRLTANYVPQHQQSDENLIANIEYNPGIPPQKPRMSRQATLPNPDQHVKLLPTSPPKRQTSPNYRKRSPEFARQNTLPNPDQFNSLTVQPSKFLPISPRLKQNFLFPAPTPNPRTFLSQQNVPTVSESDQYNSSQSVNIHNSSAKMIKVRSHSNEEYTVTRPYPPEGRRLLPEIPKSPKSLNRLVRQDNVKEDIQVQINERNARRTFAEAKQNLPEYGDDRSQQEYSDYYSDNSFLEVDETHYENNCSTGYNSEPKIIYQDSSQEMEMMGPPVTAIRSSENFINGQEIDYQMPEDANYKAIRREQIIQYNRQRRRRSREAIEATEMAAAISGGGDQMDDHNIAGGIGRRKPETMRSISEDSGVKPLIKPVTRRSLSHPEKEDQNRNRMEQTKIPSPKLLSDISEGKGKKPNKLPAIPKRRNSKTGDSGEFAQNYSSDSQSPLQQSQQKDSQDLSSGNHSKSSIDKKSPSDKNQTAAPFLIYNQQNANDSTNVTIGTGTGEADKSFGGSSDSTKTVENNKNIIKNLKTGDNNIDKGNNVDENDNGKCENDNKNTSDGTGAGTGDGGQEHKSTLGEAEIQSAVEAAAVIFKKVVLQRRQEKEEKKAAEEGDRIKKLLPSHQSSQDDSVSDQETCSSMLGAAKMYYPEGDEYKIVFISSDSSCKDDDFDESSSTTSSTPNCNSIILDDCDWDYFEPGASAVTKQILRSPYDSPIPIRRRFINNNKLQSPLDSPIFYRRNILSESSNSSVSRQRLRESDTGTDEEMLMQAESSSPTSSDGFLTKNEISIRNRIKTKFIRHHNYSGNSSSSSSSIKQNEPSQNKSNSISSSSSAVSRIPCNETNKNSKNACSCGGNNNITNGIPIQPQYVPIPVPVPIPIPISAFQNWNPADLLLSVSNTANLATSLSQSTAATAATAIASNENKSHENEMCAAIQQLWQNATPTLLQQQYQEQALNALPLQVQKQLLRQQQIQKKELIRNENVAATLTKSSSSPELFYETSSDTNHSSENLNDSKRFLNNEKKLRKISNEQKIKKPHERISSTFSSSLMSIYSAATTASASQTMNSYSSMPPIFTPLSNNLIKKSNLPVLSTNIQKIATKTDEHTCCSNDMSCSSSSGYATETTTTKQPVTTIQINTGNNNSNNFSASYNNILVENETRTCTNGTKIPSITKTDNKIYNLKSQFIENSITTTNNNLSEIINDDKSDNVIDNIIDKTNTTIKKSINCEKLASSSPSEIVGNKENYNNVDDVVTVHNLKLLEKRENSNNSNKISELLSFYDDRNTLKADTKQDFYETKNSIANSCKPYKSSYYNCSKKKQEEYNLEEGKNNNEKNQENNEDKTNNDFYLNKNSNITTTSHYNNNKKQSNNENILNTNEDIDTNLSTSTRQKENLNLKQNNTTTLEVIKQNQTSPNKIIKQITKSMITIGKIKATSNDANQDNEGYLISENMFSSSSDSETSSNTSDSQNHHSTKYSKDGIKDEIDAEQVATSSNVVNRKKSIRRCYDVASASGAQNLVISDQSPEIITAQRQQQQNVPNRLSPQYSTSDKDNMTSSSSSESFDTDDTGTIADRRPKSTKTFSKVFIVNRNDTSSSSDSQSSDANLEDSSDNDTDTERVDCGIVLCYVKNLSEENLQHSSDNESDHHSSITSTSTASNDEINLISVNEFDEEQIDKTEKEASLNSSSNENLNINNIPIKNYINDTNNTVNTTQSNLENDNGIVLNSIRKLSFDKLDTEIESNYKILNDYNIKSDSDTDNDIIEISEDDINENKNSCITEISTSASFEMQKSHDIENLNLNKTELLIIENNKIMNTEDVEESENDKLKELNSITLDVDNLLKYNTKETDLLVEKLKKNVKEINDDLIEKKSKNKDNKDLHINDTDGDKNETNLNKNSKNNNENKLNLTYNSNKTEKVINDNLVLNLQSKQQDAITTTNMSETVYLLQQQHENPVILQKTSLEDLHHQQHELPQQQYYHHQQQQQKQEQENIEEPVIKLFENPQILSAKNSNDIKNDSIDDTTNTILFDNKQNFEENCKITTKNIATTSLKEILNTTSDDEILNNEKNPVLKQDFQQIIPQQQEIHMNNKIEIEKQQNKICNENIQNIQLQQHETDNIENDKLSAQYGNTLNTNNIRYNLIEEKHAQTTLTDNNSHNENTSIANNTTAETLPTNTLPLLTPVISSSDKFNTNTITPSETITETENASAVIINDSNKKENKQEIEEYEKQKYKNNSNTPSPETSNLLPYTQNQHNNSSFGNTVNDDNLMTGKIAKTYENENQENEMQTNSSYNSVTVTDKNILFNTNTNANLSNLNNDIISQQKIPTTQSNSVEYNQSYSSGDIENIIKPENIEIETKETIVYDNANLLNNNGNNLSSKYCSLVIINNSETEKIQMSNLADNYNANVKSSAIPKLKSTKSPPIPMARSSRINIITNCQNTLQNFDSSPSQLNENNGGSGGRSQDNNFSVINFKDNSSELNNSSNCSDLDISNNMSNYASMTSLYLSKKSLSKNLKSDLDIDDDNDNHNQDSLNLIEKNDSSEIISDNQNQLNISNLSETSFDERYFNISDNNDGQDLSETVIASTSTTTTSASAPVCLEDGLADDDSWVEEISQDEEEFAGTTTTATDSDIDSNEDLSLAALIDREEELRGYNRMAIDFTLHTIIEESCEEWSEFEHDSGTLKRTRINTESSNTSSNDNCNIKKTHQHHPSTSELEKYFVFGLGDGNVMTSLDTKEESSSEVSSVCSEGLDSLSEQPVDNDNNQDPDDAAELACSRLEKYFLSGFMGYSQTERNESDGSGSVGSDSEGHPSPSQRRKRLVRARGTPRSHNSSLDNLLTKDSESCETLTTGDIQNDDNDSSDTENFHDTVIHIDKSDHDNTIKRKKQARKRHDSDETKRKSIELNDEQQSNNNDNNIETSQSTDYLIVPSYGGNLAQSKNQHSRDSGFIGSNDDLLKNDDFVRSPELKIELEDIKEDTTQETKETEGTSSFLMDLEHPNTSKKPPIHPQTMLTRKDSFNNWSSDEETNLMMSKMRQFFKTLVANSANSAAAAAANSNNGSSKNSTPIVSGTSTPKTSTPLARIKNRNKPAQLAYFESELTRLMKTVPGINDEQVREIVEYLSSEDTWSDSYDSSDYTSSDLEGAGKTSKNSVLKEQISASCQEIINKFDNPVNDREGDLGDGGLLIEEKHNLNPETALVYQKLVASFSKMTTANEDENEIVPSEPNQQQLANVNQSDKSPQLLAKVWHHIGTRLVALMHEVSSGDSHASNSPIPPQRYHKRMNQKFVKNNQNDEDSFSDTSNFESDSRQQTVQVQINNASGNVTNTDSSGLGMNLPRSKSHDLLLSDATKPQHHQSSSGVSDTAGDEHVASDYERFSWRGSFESALLANGDSRTKLTLLDRDNSSSASALAAKRRSAGDLLFNQTRLSQEQLDRVRSCGSIGGATVIEETELQTTKSWNTAINHNNNNQNRNRRSSVPDSICESDGSSGDDTTRVVTSGVDANGITIKTRSTLPRSLQPNFQTNTSTTNSLPRLPTTPLMSSVPMSKAQSAYHFLPSSVKSARYRPPGVATNTQPRTVATTKKSSSTSGLSQLLYSRRDGRRKFGLLGTNAEAAAKSAVDISSSPLAGVKNKNNSKTGSPVVSPSSASSDPWPSQSDEDIDRLVAQIQNRNSLSSLGMRSDSMASVYSGAGEGRYGTVVVKGQVEFGMQYNYKQSALEIHVVRCKDLAAVDAKRNRSDPYVKVYLLPDKSKGGKRKTKVKKHTLNPIFDEVLRFHIPLSNLDSRQLWLTVWHSDMFGRNDFLGEVTINLAGRLFDNPHPQWYLLQERSEPFDDISTYRGDIIVGLKFVPPENANSKNSLTRGSNSNLKKFGSIKGSTKNFSTKGQLHVLVKEAKNLTAIKPNGVCDAFCKSYLLPDRTRSSKQKTQVSKRTCNPIWNHTFVYEDVSLQELSERALELTIWDHDRLASNEFLGGVRFSLGTGKHYGKVVDWMDATGKELSLWQNMLNRPNFWVEGALVLRSTLDGIRALP